jgi:NNP family nitrate/nitrite transporter-like MFS transporter
MKDTSLPGIKTIQDSEDSSFLSQMGPLLFLVGIFFLNFLSRIILSPLMPVVEKDLKIGHGEAGSLFLLISMGYCVMLLASGFVSSRLNHRRSIILSSLAVGGALLIVGLSRHQWGMRFGLVVLGMGAGLYLPSGIAILTELVNVRDWGKAIAIHELAPNVSYVAAPLLVDVLLRWCSWHTVLTLFGITSLLFGTLFILFGKGGTFRGEAPNVHTLRIMLAEPTFWIMVALFSLGIGSSLGVYTMFPLYLVSERGMDRTWANTLVGLSRISPVGMAFVAGWVTDRLGPKQALRAIFLASGVITVLLGVASEHWILPIIFLQPMLACSFFPPGFAALSRMSSSSNKNVAVSLAVSVGFLLGGGVIPAVVGVVGEIGSFSIGFTILGGLLLGGVILTRFLKFAGD